MRIFEKISKKCKFQILSKRKIRSIWDAGHSTSPPCGNLVDGLPHDCHTETIAKLARLWTAKNGTTLDNFIELTMFCIMIGEKSDRISCPKYIEDLDKCIKRSKRQCHGQIHDISDFGEIPKNIVFEKISKIMKILNFLKERYKKYIGDLDKRDKR